MGAILVGMKKVVKKQQKKKEEVTLDSLASMVAGGFTELRDDMNKGFADIRGDMDEKFSAVDSKFEHMDARIGTLDHKLSALRGEVMSTHYDFKKVVARIENLELRTFGSVQE